MELFECRSYNSKKMHYIAVEMLLRTIVRETFRSKPLAQNPVDIGALYISAEAKQLEFFLTQ